MEKFESARYLANSKSEVIYGFLSDFNQLGTVLPADKVKNWKSTVETCRFTVDAVGDMGLRIAKTEPFGLVQYAGDGKVPFNFYLSVILVENSNETTEVLVVAEAQLNVMMKMLVSSPVNKFVDTLAKAIAGNWAN